MCGWGVESSMNAQLYNILAEYEGVIVTITLITDEKVIGKITNYCDFGLEIDDKCFCPLTSIACIKAE